MPAICLEEVAEISSIDCICKPEYSVERRHNSVYSQRIPTDWANRRCCGDARVVHEIPWSNDIITSNVGFLGDSVVEELGLINYTVFCRVGKNLGDVSIKIFCCHLIGNLAQLTLFPRVSKTSKANRRNFRLFSHHSPPNRVFSSAIPAMSNSFPVS